MIDEPAKAEKQPSKPTSTTAPTQTPEEVLRAFWVDFAACQEDPKWDEMPKGKWPAFRAAAKVIFEQFCTERIIEGWESAGRQMPSKFNSQFEEAVVETKVQKTKAFVYTHRPDYCSGKYCWVLLLIDGEWKVERRKKEGFKLDQYREIAIC